MKPQIINKMFYTYDVKYKDGNDVRYKHMWATNLKQLFEQIETWKKMFCIYQDDIIEIKQIMEAE